MGGGTEGLLSVSARSKQAKFYPVLSNPRSYLLGCNAPIITLVSHYMPGGIHFDPKKTISRTNVNDDAGAVRTVGLREVEQ